MSVRNFLITIILCFGFYLYQGSKQVATKTVSDELSDPELREETLAEMEQAMTKVMKKHGRTFASVEPKEERPPEMTMEEVVRALEEEDPDNFSRRSELIGIAQSLNPNPELEELCFRELDTLANLEGYQDERSAPLDRHAHKVLTALSSQMEPERLTQELERMLEETPSNRLKQILEVYIINREIQGQNLPEN